MDDIQTISMYPDIPPNLAQLVLEGFTVKHSTTRTKRGVAKTIAKLHQLHDELSAQLYTNPTERPAIQSPQDAYCILRCFIGNLDHSDRDPWVIPSIGIRCIVF